MDKVRIKGKTASLIGVIIGILSMVLASIVFYIAFNGSFERVFVLVAGGLALFCLIGILVSFRGSSKMKRSGANNFLGKLGLILSSLSLISALTLLGISANTVPPDNIVLPEKEFNTEMDDMLKQLNAGRVKDSIHADSVQRGLLPQ